MNGQTERNMRWGRGGRAERRIGRREKRHFHCRSVHRARAHARDRRGAVRRLAGCGRAREFMEDSLGYVPSYPQRILAARLRSLTVRVAPQDSRSSEEARSVCKCEIVLSVCACVRSSVLHCRCSMSRTVVVWALGLLVAPMKHFVALRRSTAIMKPHHSQRPRSSWFGILDQHRRSGTRFIRGAVPLHSMRYRRPVRLEDISETKACLISYDGSAHGLHEWSSWHWPRSNARNKKSRYSWQTRG